MRYFSNYLHGLEILSLSLTLFLYMSVCLCLKPQVIQCRHYMRQFIIRFYRSHSAQTYKMKKHIVNLFVNYVPSQIAISTYVKFCKRGFFYLKNYQIFEKSVFKIVDKSSQSEKNAARSAFCKRQISKDETPLH